MKIHQKILTNILILIATIICPQMITAQHELVWPGDVTTNGQVNTLDIIYIGMAFGTEGPERELETNIWPPNNVVGNNDTGYVATPWDIFFPGTDIDYAHADCNGDGVIDKDDLEAIALNQNEINPPPAPNFFDTGEEGDPIIALVPSVYNTVEGQAIEVDVLLGDSENEITDFYGISFTLKYDPIFIEEGTISYQFSQDDSWIGTGNDDEMIVNETNDFEDGEMVVTLVRTNGNPVSGSGSIGKLDFIIEDHVIGLGVGDAITDTLDIDVENVILLDISLQPAPLVSENTSIVVEEVEALATNNILNNSITLFPNPTKEGFKLLGIDQVDIKSMSMYNTLGKQIPIRINSNEVELNATIPNGIYLLRIVCEEGIVIKTISIK